MKTHYFYQKLINVIHSVKIRIGDVRLCNLRRNWFVVRNPEKLLLPFETSVSRRQRGYQKNNRIHIYQLLII